MISHKKLGELEFKNIRPDVWRKDIIEKYALVVFSRTIDEYMEFRKISVGSHCSLCFDGNDASISDEDFERVIKDWKILNEA